MRVTVGMMRDLVAQLAPWELAEPWDNVGLLIGHPDREVDTVLVAMDATPAVLAEAREEGAQLLITHHPLLFSKRRDLCEEDREGTMTAEVIRANLSLIAAHTNWDKASGGVNDALLRALALPAGEGQGMIRTVTLPEPLGLSVLSEAVRATLGDGVRCFCLPDDEEPVRRLAVCGGAGGEFWREALQSGADCLLTGECKHHEALEAAHFGLRVLAAGHYATEQPGVLALCRGLQTASYALQYSVRIVASIYPPFASEGSRA